MSPTAEGKRVLRYSFTFDPSSQPNINQAKRQAGQWFQQRFDTEPEMGGAAKVTLIIEEVDPSP